MARSKSIDIRNTLTSAPPPEELERLARDSGFVQRRRRLDPVAMLWTLALGFGDGTERSFASLRRLYGRMSGPPMAPASCQARFDAALVRLLRAVLSVLVERLAATRTDSLSALLAALGTSVPEGVLLPVKVARLLGERLEATLLREAPDPNVKRLSLLERVDRGTPWTA